MIELNLPAKQNYIDATLKQKDHWAKQDTIIFESAEEFNFFLDIYQWHHRPWKILKTGTNFYPVEFLDIEKKKKVD